ncbi:MAG: hypothetical protein HQK51_15045, partial [Oligoflexia bacterium]|nr:hypothetical protein [Oligoflexia bacterium]
KIFYVNDNKKKIELPITDQEELFKKFPTFDGKYYLSKGQYDFIKEKTNIDIFEKNLNMVKNDIDGHRSKIDKYFKNEEKENKEEDKKKIEKILALKNQAKDHLKHDAKSFSCGSKDKDEKEIDLRSKDNCMAKIRTRNQGGIGICYAETAVQMYDALLRSGNVDTKVEMPEDFHSSAVMIALEDKGFEGGQPVPIINKLFKEGSCKESKLETTIQELSSFNRELAKIFKKYQSGFEEKKMAARPITKDEYSEREKKKKELMQEIQKEIEKEGNEIFSKTICGEVKVDKVLEKLFGDINDIVFFLESDSEKTNFMRNLLKKLCSEQDRLNVKGLDKKFKAIEYDREFVAYKDDIRLAEIINKELEKPKPLPIAVGICGKMLDEGSAVRAIPYKKELGKYDSLKFFRESKEAGKDCDRHAVLISGRKKKNGVCMYKITNSWGNKCKEIWPKEDCDTKNGDVWIDARDIMRNVFKIGVIERLEEKKAVK